tara:strand:+ start:466 stop:918 length:453 start_codon:yes stop_codon:yes gene_type:complete
MELIILIFVIYIFYKIGNSSSNSKKSFPINRVITNDIDYPYKDMGKAINIIYKFLSKNNVKNAKAAAEYFPVFIDTLIDDYKERRSIYYPDEIKEDIKSYKWFTREITKLENDMKAIMKKYMSYTKSEKGHYPKQLWELDLPKELPDSYN